MRHFAFRVPHFAILLREAPRWLFLAALVYAPWAYGCTTENTIEALNCVDGVPIALWLLS